jgi:DNA-directed RNA polymerase sigma subunit (sigma70/sigma32)
LINKSWTPKEIGDIWGLPRKRVKQCEATALKKVREGNRFNRRNPWAGSLETRTFT